MPFNINIFKEDVDKKGYIKSHDFEVIIAPPPVMGSDAGSVTKLMSYRIEQVRVPGINLMNLDVNRYGVGPTQKQPYNAMFNEISFNMIADAYGDIWQFWHEWMRKIYDFTPQAAPKTGNVSTDATYGIEYKDRYSTTASIVIYDPFGAAVKRIDMYQAYPTAIRDIPLSWADQGNLVKISVGITFKEYTVVQGQ